jgi:hypothetical protein
VAVQLGEILLPIVDGGDESAWVERLEAREEIAVEATQIRLELGDSLVEGGLRLWVCDTSRAPTEPVEIALDDGLAIGGA